MKKLIGITGRRRSGKDTAARALMPLGYNQIAFAAALKVMLHSLFEYLDISDGTIERMIEGDLKEMPLPILEGKSPRYAMQTLGTEWGRGLLGKNIWIHIGIERTKNHEHAVISDVRFPNEAEAVRAAGGSIVKIERPTTVDDCLHTSETEIDKIHPDFTILNIGTIQQLRGFIQDYARGN